MPKFIDRTGQKFNRLTFIEYKGNRKWLCKCNCGNYIITTGTGVAKGLAKSCGCYNLELIKIRAKTINFKDITGLTFNYLTAIKYLDNSKWLFKCKCGKEKIITGYDVVKGNIKSCGCYNIEVCKKNRIPLMLKAITKHNHSSRGIRSITYHSWGCMKARCYNKNHPRYKDWGGRGIKVCDEWKNDFVNFLEDMRERPSKEYTIDRIDNNKNYCKENCRWATKKEQGRNTRKTKTQNID